MRNSVKAGISLFLVLAGLAGLAYRLVYSVQAEETIPRSAGLTGMRTSVSKGNGAVVERAAGLAPQLQEAASEVDAARSHAVDPSSIRNRLPETIAASPVIDEFRRLYTEFARQYVHAGWLHLVYREEHPAADGPNETEYGITIPATYLTENWYLLDGNGQVVQGVSFMRDVNGGLIQVSVYRDKVWRNATLGTEMRVESAPVVRLDGGYLAQMEDAYLEGGTIGRMESVLDGKAILRFEQTETFAPPILLYGYSRPVRQARKIAYVSPSDGQILLGETHFVTVNGEEVTFLRTILLRIENTAPPEDVLAYLADTE